MITANSLYSRIVVLIILTFSVLSTAQTNLDSIEKSSKTGLNPWGGRNGIRFESNFVSEYQAEVSYLVTSYPLQEPGFGAMIMRLRSIGLGTTYLRINQQNIFGLKASYEESFNILSAQISTEYFTSFGESQVRVTPKFGLTAFGFLTLFYNWNIDLISSSSIKSRKENLTAQIMFLF